MNDPMVEILLVEDNPNDVELILHALKKNHLMNPIHVVHDGVEALDFIFNTGDEDAAGVHQSQSPGHTPRIVLLDLKLPKVDGLEVLKRIKTDPSTQMTPVIMLTSSRQERDIVESYKLGVNSYLVKPVDFEQFVEAVKNLGLYWLLMNQPPVM